MGERRTLRGGRLLPVIALLLPALVAAGGPGRAAPPGAPASANEAAAFLVGFPTEATTFVLLLTDPDRIGQARAILAQGLSDEYIFGGVIVKAPAPWNPRWSYHVEPGTVVFGHVFVEVCDAHPQYVEEHLDEVGGAFLPGGFWCPWTSRLLREIAVNPPTPRLYLPLILGPPDQTSAAPRM